MLSDLNQEMAGNTLSQALISPYTTYVCAMCTIQYTCTIGGYTY